MSEPASPTASAPQSPTAAAPGGAEPSPASTASPAGSEPAALVKPEFLPAEFWDDKAGIKTDDFAAHYGGLTAAAAKAAERAAAVPAKPEDYKIELKLPEGVTAPEGIKFDPAKDPRTPVLLKAAHELGLTNTDVNRLIALDAQFAIEEHLAKGARVAAETKKLGENGAARIEAAKSWLAAQTGDGKRFTADEAADVRAMATSAAGVTALEKLMAIVNGSVPGHVPTPPPTPAPQSHADRIWPGGFSRTPQARIG